MSVKNISSAILGVGVDDTTIDLFESQYPVPTGVSYNSYIIRDEKTAILDTVDVRATDEWMANVTEALAGEKPAYLVVHHMEPDHGANVARLAALYPEMQVVGNAKTFQYMEQFFGPEAIAKERRVVVKDGESLSLGAHTLTFVFAPMVHWPEVMVSYESTEKVLFSADGFGRFGAVAKFDEKADWASEARRYYLNIVGKYGPQVQALLKKAAALDIKTICPLHGPVLTGDLGKYLNYYDLWSSYKAEEPEKVLVASASIHGHTRAAAHILAEKLRAKGAKAVEIDLADCPDLGPVLIALGCFCSGTTIIRNAGRLRIKECDRIAAMQEELAKMGGTVKADGDTLTIEGCALHKPTAPLNGHNDHRIVMAMAVAALAAGQPAVIEGANAVNKSWPDFFEVIKGLGAHVTNQG